MRMADSSKMKILALNMQIVVGNYAENHQV
jgi:hypothetical protein